MAPPLTKRRHPSSKAIVALREALGLNQTMFAVKVMDVAISTIGRWETNYPPTGDTLLQLAEIAERKGFRELQETFDRLYVETLPERARAVLVREYGAKFHD